MEGNLWSKMNEPMINKLIYKLEELRMRGTVDHELNVSEIMYLIRGLIKENKDINEKNKELEERIKTVKKDVIKELEEKVKNVKKDLKQE